MVKLQIIKNFEHACTIVEEDDDSSGAESSSSGGIQAKVDHNSVGGTAMANMPWFLYPPANN